MFKHNAQWNWSRLNDWLCTLQMCRNLSSVDQWRGTNGCTWDGFMNCPAAGTEDTEFQWRRMSRVMHWQHHQTWHAGAAAVAGRGQEHARKAPWKARAQRRRACPCQVAASHLGVKHHLWAPDTPCGPSSATTYLTKVYPLITFKNTIWILLFKCSFKSSLTPPHALRLSLCSMHSKDRSSWRGPPSPDACERLALKHRGCPAVTPSIIPRHHFQCLYGNFY